MRCAILTISTGVSRRVRDDASGELLARRAEEAGADVDAMEVVPDDFSLIEDRLQHFADEYGEPYARLAVLLNEARGWAKGTLPTYQDRKDFFEGIVNGDPDPIELLRDGDEQAVRDLIAAAQHAAA